MIHSGLKGAARALPHPQLTAASRVGTVTCSTAPQHFCSSGRTVHQRRPSSSKASCPPGDRSDGPRAAAAPKAETAPAKASPPRTASGRQHGTRAQRGRKAREEAWQVQRNTASNTLFDKLPSVPNTNSLSEKDLKLSSLFALHRPLSLTIPIPPPMEQTAFDKIFESRTPRPVQPADVVSTISSTIEMLEGRRQDHELQWQTVSDGHGPEVHHLDGAPAYQPRTVEELVARMKPYEKPPVPKPLVASTDMQQQGQRQTKRTASQRKSRSEATSQHQNQRTFEGTVIIREHGPTMYSAEFTSIKPLTENQDSPSKRLRMPFGTRVRVSRVMRAMNNRQPAAPTTVREPSAHKQRVTLPSGMRWQSTRPPLPSSRSGQGMFAISVKRQRKLKMKKHKYKKLMKRTRTLRRKLDK